MLTLIILNFNSKYDLIQNINKYITFKLISEIIISNGNENYAISKNDIITNSKIRIRNDYLLNNNYDFNLRFIIASDVLNDIILFIDDNFFLDEDAINKLYTTFLKKKCIVGTFGENDKNYNFPFVNDNYYGSVPIINSNCSIQCKNLCKLYVKFLPFIRDFFNGIKPFGYGNYIINSFLGIIFYKKYNFSIKIKGIKKNKNSSTNQMLHKIKLYKFLWYNFNFFENFIFSDHKLLKIKEKRLILTISIGNRENIIKYTKYDFINYAEKCNAEFKLVTEPIYRNKCNVGNHNGLKNNSSYIDKVAVIIKYLKEYDRILWVDDTIKINPETPNIFDLTDRNFIYGFNEGKNFNSSSSDYKFIRKNKNFNINIGKYINSGFVIYPKIISNDLEKSLQSNYSLFSSNYPHQCFLNYTIQKFDMPLKLLSKSWNNHSVNLLQEKLGRKNFIYRKISTHYNNPQSLYIKYLSGSFVFHITGGHGDLNSRQKVLSKINFNN